MKRRSIFLMSQLILMCLIFSMIVTELNAEISFNLKPMSPERGTEEGSALMFRSFSKLFTSFEALEHGNIDRANKMVEESHAAQLKATGIYNDFASQMPSLAITMANMTSDKIKIIENDFRLYGLEIPNNYKELAALAYKEVKCFAEFVSKVNFADDPARNRQTVRKLIDRLNRYMRLGISVAEIAASQEKQ